MRYGLTLTSIFVQDEVKLHCFSERVAQVAVLSAS